VTRIVVERDDTVAQHDRRILFAADRKAPQQLAYALMAPHEEPTLWVPDAVAWCWTKDRPWRALIEHLVEGKRSCDIAKPRRAAVRRGSRCAGAGSCCRDSLPRTFSTGRTLKVWVVAV
jgi:hypothetical protein